MKFTMSSRNSGRRRKQYTKNKEAAQERARAQMAEIERRRKQTIKDVEAARGHWKAQRAEQDRIKAQNRANAGKRDKKGHATTHTTYTGKKITTQNGRNHKSAYNMSESTEETRKHAIQDTKAGQVYAGITTGVLNATPVALALPTDEEREKNGGVKSTKYFKAGEFIGEAGSYLTGYGAVNAGRGLLSKGTVKIVGSKAGQRAVEKVAGTKIIKNAAEKQLAKEGKIATKKAIENQAKKHAEKLVTSSARDLLTDATLGTAMDNNVAVSDGEKMGSKEWAKTMGVNALMNVGIGGVSEIAPTVFKGLKGTKKTGLLKQLAENDNITAKVGGIRADTKASVKPAREAQKIEREAFAKELTKNNPKLYKKANAERVKNAISNNQTKMLKERNTATGRDVNSAVPDMNTLKRNRNVNTATTKILKQNPVELIKNKEFLDFLSKGNINPIQYAKENNISNTEAVRNLYDNYVSTYKGNVKKYRGNDIKTKKLSFANMNDLGADNYKESTHELNMKNYGSDRGIEKGTPYGEVSQGAITIANSPMLDETSKKAVRATITDGTQSKVFKSNQTILANAQRSIDANPDIAFNTFSDVMENGKQVKSDDIALGYKLAEYYQNTNDYDKLTSVLSDVVNMEGESGRILQAMNIFNKLTPEGRVKTVIKSHMRMSEKLGREITPNNELLEKLSKATSEADITKINNQIAVDMWNQVPANWVEKVNAWRYMAMLCNPKTMIRNIIGNAIFVPVKGIRNTIATGLEKAIIKDGTRSKAILTHADKDLVELGKSDFDNVVDTIKGNGRYIDSARSLDAKMFNSKTLESIRKGTSWGLEKGDEVFMEFAYKRSFAQHLKANGFTAKNATEEALANARKYATEECLNSTYRDANTAAEWLQKQKKYVNTPLKDIPGDNGFKKVGKKAGGIFFESVVPFSKTPANIIKRGIEYSPFNLLHGVQQMLKANGDQELLIKGISNLSAGLTGTGIVGLGIWLGNSGIAQGSLDTSTTDGQYAKMLGAQGYSINVGDYTYTLDWAVPAAMPFFVGVEISNGIGDTDFGAVLDSLSKISDPVFNLSMLSGIQNVFDTSFSDGSAILNILKNSGESYISQFLPTLGGQIAKTLTSETRTTTSTNPDSTLREYGRFANQLKNKVPGLADTNEPLVDLWGRTEKKETAKDYALAALQNFISPGTLKKSNVTDVDAELLELSNSLSDDDVKDILPEKTSTYKYQLGDIEYNMEPADLTAYKKVRGQQAGNGLSELFNSSEYSSMSSAEKVKAIKNIYDEANTEAKKQFFVSKGNSRGDVDFEVDVSSEAKARYSGVSNKVSKGEYADAYNAQKKYNSGAAKIFAMHKAGVDDFNVMQAIYGSTSQGTYYKAQDISHMGLSPAEVDSYTSTEVSEEIDYNGNGRKSKAEIMNYLDSQGYSQDKKRMLFRIIAPGNYRNPY